MISRDSLSSILRAQTCPNRMDSAAHELRRAAEERAFRADEGKADISFSNVFLYLLDHFICVIDYLPGGHASIDCMTRQSFHKKDELDALLACHFDISLEFVIAVLCCAAIEKYNLKSASFCYADMSRSAESAILFRHFLHVFGARWADRIFLGHTRSISRKARI